MKPNQEQLIAFYHSNTIIDYLNIDVIPMDNEEIRIELSVKESHTNFCDICHGGVLTTMADTAMGGLCFALNKKVVTMNLTIDFIHAVPMMTKVIAVPRMLHNGRTTMLCECDMVDGEGKLFAKAHATFFVIGPFIETE